MLRRSGYHMITREELQQRIQDSAINIFSVMADIALVECHDGTNAQLQNWITALVGFEGVYSGLVVLHCPEQLAQRTAAGLLGTPGKVAVQDVHDAMGEVVNILGGDMKLYLDSGGRRVQLSTPSVFTGDGQFQGEFLQEPDTVAFAMSAGDERLLIGVQVCREE